MPKTDQAEREIEQILAAADGRVSVNFIPTQLYHRYRVTPSRKNLQDMLSKMIRKGSVVSLEGRHGFYRIGNP